MTYLYFSVKRLKTGRFGQKKNIKGMIIDIKCRISGKEKSKRKITWNLYLDVDMYPVWNENEWECFVKNLTIHFYSTCKKMRNSLENP